MSDTPATGYKKYAILYVDDETQSLAMFREAYGDEFRIFTAPTAREGLKVLEQHADEIGILMTDQRMPGEKGVWLLEHARQLRPGILRILATAYTDMDAAAQAVNTGAIYKFINKPWDPVLLEQTLRRGLEFFELQLDREELLKENSALLRERMIASRMGSLGLVAAGLNHHILNSMSAVKTFLDLAAEPGGAASLRDPELQQGVRAEIGKILGLLADLRIAEPGSGETAFADAVDAKILLEDILAKLQAAFAARQISVETKIPDGLPALRCDRPKIRRLFELLLNDELALLPAGSRLAIAAEAAETNRRPGLAVTLTDNGRPLPLDTLRLVLDPFATQGKPSEYGINLLICSFIIHHHGGRLEAGVLAGGGNQFVIRLPLEPLPA